MSPSYIVVCRWRDADARISPRVVGPFATQQEAVEWAQEMRNANATWDYTPDVMESPR